MKSARTVRGAIALASILTLSACASLTPTREVTEGYRIYDITGTSSHSIVAENLKTAMQENADNVRFNNAIPPSPLPEKPGRFQLKEPFSGSGFGALMAAQGASLKVPECEGSIVSATSNEDFQDTENTTFFVCLMPYTEGYHMNVYYTFTKVSGGFNPKVLGNTLASAIVGDSSKFIPRTIAALENAVEAAGAELALVEAYPQK